MRKLLALGLGAALLVVGTGAVLAQTTPSSTPAANPAASAAPSAKTPSTTGVAPKVRGDSLLDKVLKDLVADGTIDQQQADAITAKLKTERDALRADLKAKAEAARKVRQQIRDFLKDGVITADELAQAARGQPASEPRQAARRRQDHARRAASAGRGSRQARLRPWPWAEAAAERGPIGITDDRLTRAASGVSAATWRFAPQRPVPSSGDPRWDRRIRDRERHREGRAAARRRAMHDRPAVRLHDRRRDGQP